MRRLYAWLGGIAGGAALVRVATRRRRALPAPAPAEDPAAQLRAKLAESRTLVDEQEADAAGETPVDREDPEERRRRIHEQGRAALDEMQRRPES